jgi:gliding motility-associated-like protein
LILRKSSILIFAGILPFSLFGQQDKSYVLHGSASRESCNCYQLTPDLPNQSGSVWNKGQINLGQSFNFVFNVFLGCKDPDGGDGITFVLQPYSSDLAAKTQGIGFENITPSVGIPIDTWQNPDDNDPFFDHIGIYKNGDLVNGSPNTWANPVQAIADNPNIEDCQWHLFRIIWDAVTHILSAQIDNVTRVQTHIDLVNDIFGTNPRVFWGFTSTTGAQGNMQKFCPALNPGIIIPGGIQTCAPALILFEDNSTSFGQIINWYWDFDDGTTFSGKHPEPHAYLNPGFYTLKLNIEGDDGCFSDTLYRSFVIGSVPTAGFTYLPSVICAKTEVIFLDSSTVKEGKINQWNWSFNNGAEQIQKLTPGLTKTFSEGKLTIALTTQTAEGCVSEPYIKSMDITLKPSIKISVQENACYSDPVSMDAENLSPEIPIRQWYWLTGDGKQDSTSNLNYYYAAGGKYSVEMYAVNYTGCSSDTATAQVTIYQTQAKAGNDTVVAIGQPLQLQATGGELYQWIPGDGLNNSFIANPVAILNQNIQYIVKAYTSFGCPTYDTINIKTYRGPAFYAPNAFTPDNNGINDRFHPVSVGMQSIDHFEVFNRLGQKVYSNPGIGQGWDGTLNDKPQPMGTYVWIIMGKDYLGNQHFEKGIVVLIR